MDNKNTPFIVLVVILCIISFAAGMYFSSTKEACEQASSQVQQGQPQPSLLPPGNYTPPGGNLSVMPPPLSPSSFSDIPAGAMPIFGVIDSLQSEVLVLKTITPPFAEKNQTPKRILLDGSTKVLLNVVSTNQTQIDEFNKNLPLNFPEGVPKPKLYVLKEGSVSDLKEGMSVTVFGEGDVQLLEEFIALRIMTSPTG